MKPLYYAFLFCLLELVTSAPNSTDDPVVTTKLGTISGKRIIVIDTLVDQYLGIPYAKPMTMESRYKKAEPINKYNSTIEAYTMPPRCPQNVIPLSELTGDTAENINEDCLYLNIWNPVNSTNSSKDDSLKAVMVWIHGGAFRLGSIDSPLASGRILSPFGDVIIVAMNYRLGSFGFFTSGSQEEPGNLGLYDQNLALQWVKQNIAYFGGDPDKITIFGGSAGSMSVSYHTISPKSRGLFQRAILESGTYLTPVYLTNSQPLLDTGLLLAQKVGCASENENFQTDREKIMKCLRSKEVNEILEKEAEIKTMSVGSFLPLYGEEFLPLDSVRDFSAHSDKDMEIMVGATEEEGNVMLLSYIFDMDFIKPENIMKKTEALQHATQFIGEHFKNPEKLTAPYFENVEENDVIGSRQALSDIITDSYYVCPSILYANAVAENDGQAYLYFFTHYSKKPSASPDWVRSSHGVDAYYVFGVPLDPSEKYPEIDVEFSKHMMTLWTNFAKEGMLQNWKRYESNSNIALELNPLRNSTLDVPRAKWCYDLWVPAYNEKLGKTEN